MNSMINPTAPLNSEADARAAARASAIAIAIGVAMGALGVFLLMNGGLAEVEAAVKAQAGDDPTVAGMTGAMTQGALYFSIFLVLVQAVLGWVQWAKPNVYIPIVFLILVVYGLGTSALGMMTMGDGQVPQTSMNGPAMMVLSIVALLIQALLHAIGIRGATALNKMRQAGAAD